MKVISTSLPLCVCRRKCYILHSGSNVKSPHIISEVKLLFLFNLECIYFKLLQVSEVRPSPKSKHEFTALIFQNVAIRYKYFCFLHNHFSFSQICLFFPNRFIACYLNIKISLNSIISKIVFREVWLTIGYQVCSAFILRLAKVKNVSVTLASLSRYSEY